MNYETDWFARQRIQEWLHDAERERLAGAGPMRRRRRRGWLLRPALGLRLLARIARRVGAASGHDATPRVSRARG